MGMPDPKKQRYYQENREKRLAYQKAYYERYKLRRPRLRELEEYLDPEEFEARRKARSAYNRAYYKSNREKIQVQRAEHKKRVAFEARVK